MVKKLSINENYNDVNDIKDIVGSVSVQINAQKFVNNIIKLIRSTLDNYSISYEYNDTNDRIIIETNNSHSEIYVGCNIYEEGILRMFHSYKLSPDSKDHCIATIIFNMNWNKNENAMGFDIDAEIDHRKFNKFVTNMQDVQTLIIEPMLECAGLIWEFCKLTTFLLYKKKTNILLILEQFMFFISSITIFL